MYQILGATVDVIHALLMVAWVVTLPLLFTRRWPRARRAVSIFAVGFVVLNQGSRLVLGECVLTTIARHFWQQTSATPLAGDPAEWFAVRLANAVFHMTPSRRSIVVVSQALAFATATGVILSELRSRPHGDALRGWCRSLRPPR